MDYFAASPGVALTIILLASFLEAVAVIGTFIPGGTVVFVSGVLVGVGSLDFWPVFSLAVFGAILGDGFSYWLGHRYREQIRLYWPFNKKPEILNRAMDFFLNHGGKSIILGRFIAPIRCIVPVVAGIAGMAPANFYFLNVVSAFGWAAAHILPGALFGASLQVAGAISERLVLILVVLLVLFWVVIQLVTAAYRQGAKLLKMLRSWLISWAQKNPGKVSHFVISLVDPEQPESPVLLMSSVFMVAGMLLFFRIFQSIVSNNAIIQTDDSIYELFKGTRTAWIDSVMISINEFGGLQSLFIIIVFVFLWLATHRLWKTMGYWLSGVFIAEIAVLVMKYMIGRQHPDTAVIKGMEMYSFPSSHATLIVVVYGLLVILLTRRKSLTIRISMTSIVAMFIAITVFSRLYLGMHWLSDILGGMGLGLMWVALLGIAYIHHRPAEDIHPRRLLFSILLILGVNGYFTIAYHHDDDMQHYSQKPVPLLISMNEWRNQVWEKLPAERFELDRNVQEPFTIQWSGSAEEVTKAMATGGWHLSPPWSAHAVSLWLLPNPELKDLPVLTKFNKVHEPQLTFIREMDKDHRLVLRLWRSHFTITGDSAATIPLWYGMVTEERLESLPAITLVHTMPDCKAATQQLIHDINGKQLRINEVIKGQRDVYELFPMDTLAVNSDGLPKILPSGNHIE